MRFSFVVFFSTEQGGFHLSRQIKKLVLSALFLALGLVLPFFTMQIPQIGSMLLPMHLPVLLCGFLCGGGWGLAVGAITPLLRSLLFTMPYLFPTASAMAFELAAYGLLAGILYRLLKKTTFNLYLSLLITMIGGRIVWGIVMTIFSGISGSEFGFATFFAGAVTTALPGILLQILIIPPILLALRKSGHFPE